jgi:Cu-processing system ATP-binding protein
VNLLELRDVSVRFRSVEALNHVTLGVEAGQIVLLAGPNGAGKSTLIGVLLGLVRPDTGSLAVDGKKRVVDNTFKRSLGYLPEAVAFADNLSGRQVLGFFARARGAKRSRIDAVLERVGLTHAARRAVRGYSRGMKQRLGLALAILSDPEILVLDEPTGGLDQEGLNVLWSILSEWQAKDRMVLMASHDLTLLERRVDRICLLKKGRLCADDEPGRLRRSAALPVRVHFELQGDHDKFVAAIRAWDGTKAMEIEANRLRVDIDGDSLVGLMNLRSGFEGVVVGVRVVEPGLDLVYEHLLEREGE